MSRSPTTNPSFLDGAAALSDAKSKPRITTAGRSYAALRADIISGALEPASRLRITEMCARYDIGQIPLREALNRLAAESLVTYSDQRGFTVASITDSDLEDLTRARNMATESALRESVRHGDAAWEEQLVLAFHRLSKVPNYLDTDRLSQNPDYERPHRAFHIALVSGCRSRWMVDCIAHLFDHADRYRNLSRRVFQPARDQEHRAIFDAVLARNEEEAVRLLHAHHNVTATLASRSKQARDGGVGSGA